MGSKGFNAWTHLLRVDRENPSPLFEQICSQIRQAIEKKRLLPGTCLPTNRQLVAHLDVNYKTVQRALAILAEEGYVARWRGKGTFVQIPPRRGLVGLFCLQELIDPARHSFYSAMLSRLAHCLAARGREYRVYLGAGLAGTSTAAFRDLQADLEQGRLAGLVLFVYDARLDPIVARAAEQAVPMVTYSRRASWRSAAPSAASMHQGSPFEGYQDNLLEIARQIFAEEGRHRTGYVLNETEPAARKSVAMIRPAIPSTWAAMQYPTVAGGYVAAASLPLHELDSLVVNDDVMALGVERLLLERAVAVPDKLQVVTHWNEGSRFDLQLPFHKIQLNLTSMAMRTVDLLSNAMAGQLTQSPHQLWSRPSVQYSQYGSASEVKTCHD